jgi:hypothetical protein
MNRLTSIAALAAIAILAQGCGSSSRMADMIGVSKSAPDETQIRTTQSLSMPPDLSLPPPAAEVAEEDGQLATISTGARAAPPSDATAAAAPSDTGLDDSAIADPAPVPQAPAQTAAAPSTDPMDPYAPYGISKTKPDGTAKTQEELYNELRAARLAEKRKANPNYGTIFNVGDLFKDG